MSNLGGYQKIVEDAHRSGGAEKLIKNIYDSGRRSMTPKVVGYTGAGVLGGTLLGIGIHKLYIRHQQKKEIRRLSERETERKLIEEIEAYEAEHPGDKEEQ